MHRNHFPQKSVPLSGHSDGTGNVSDPNGSGPFQTNFSFLQALASQAPVNHLRQRLAGERAQGSFDL